MLNAQQQKLSKHGQEKLVYIIEARSLLYAFIMKFGISEEPEVNTAYLCLCNAENTLSEENSNV